MITYKLAKELKDLEFPQSFDTIPTVNPLIQPSRYERGNDGEYILIPTLSELIEACRISKPKGAAKVIEMFIGATVILYIITRPDGTLLCSAENGGKDNCLVQGMGSSPEEAVAKLWLELNKK